MNGIRATCSAFTKVHVCISICAVVMIVSNVNAQSGSESAFFEDLPTVLSASRLPQALKDTPGALTVIDRETIRALGYWDIASYLKLVPGIQVVHDRGHAPYVAYHGLGTDFPNKMQVLVDGRSVYSADYMGGVDWNGIPITLDEIERIEVLRGSNSATYGSNAVMGVVNIITRHSTEDQGTSVKLAAGNYRIREAGFQVGRSSENFSYRISGQGHYDQGFDLLEDNSRLGTLSFRGDLTLNKQNELTIWAGYNQGRRGWGFANEPTNSNGIRDQRTRNGFVQLRIRHAPSENEEISLGYYHNEDRASEAFNAYWPPLLPVIPINVDRAAVRDNLDYQHILSLSSSLRAVWGVELRRDALDSRALFFSTGSESTTFARAFGNAEWRPSLTLTVNAGVMWERYAEHSAKLAPRLFTNWHVAPGHTVRLGVSRAYRAPSLFEERADNRFMVSDVLVQQVWLAPGKLKPEAMTAGEIGYLAQSLDGNATFDLRLFHEDLRNQIIQFDTPSPPSALLPGTFSFANSPSGAILRGIEYQLKLRIRPATAILVNQSLLNINSSADPAQDRSAAHNTFGVTWMQRYLGAWSSAVTMQHVGAYQWGGGSKAVAAHNSIDLRLAHEFRWEGRQIEVALVMLNLGPRYEEFLLDSRTGFNAVSRYAYLTGRLAF